jgi:biotin carboxyl carrier protein
LKLRLTVDGKVYEVEVEAEEQQPLQPGYVPPWASPAAAPTAATPAAAAPAASVSQVSDTVADETKVCRSPISGMVVRVSVQPGHEINLNDELMVLEAMKMETVITAPVAGKIKRINVQAGESVKARQVLLEIE